jgi:hypothetical protein
MLPDFAGEHDNKSPPDDPCRGSHGRGMPLVIAVSRCNHGTSAGPFAIVDKILALGRADICHLNDRPHFNRWPQCKLPLHPLSLFTAPPHGHRLSYLLGPWLPGPPAACPSPSATSVIVRQPETRGKAGLLRRWHWRPPQLAIPPDSGPA